MKTIRIIALVLACAASGRAADPLVEVKSVTEVRVDGANVGAVADAIANNPKLAPAIQRALVAWCDKVTGDQQAAQAGADALRAFAAGLIGRAKSAIAGGDTKALEKIIAEAEMPAQDRQKAEIEKQIADLQAKKAVLEAAAAGN